MNVYLLYRILLTAVKEREFPRDIARELRKFQPDIKVDEDGGMFHSLFDQC